MHLFYALSFCRERKAIRPSVLLALFMDMKPDTTNCVYRITTRFGQRILRYKGSQLWNRLPSNLTNSTASQPYRKKLKLLLSCDPM